MTGAAMAARRKHRWHRPRPALPPGHEPGNHTSGRWSWSWSWVRPRDAREHLARWALSFAIVMWMPLARPLGGIVATVGILFTAAVCVPAYANWQRRRIPASRRNS